MNNTDYILEIYGDGDYRAELVELAAKHDRIIYKGLVSRDVIVARQKQVALLINPRPSSYEYTQYSFPSKIMEYMLSGTPVLTTKLPGIPMNMINICIISKTNQLRLWPIKCPKYFQWIIPNV